MCIRDRNAPDSKMDEMMAANLSKSEGIETYSMNTLVGNIEGDQPNTVFANWIFECDDQQAVKDSHELDWKYYKEGGCSGIDIHQMNGGDYASNGTYMFVARFNSMEQLGSCMDHMWSKSDYMKSSADYHSKIKIINKDYRTLEGLYDKIVSIEMIEAVGYEYIPVYFKKLSSLLKPNGLMALQGITYNDQNFDSSSIYKISSGK